MKNIILVLLVLSTVMPLWAQDFFRNTFDTEKKYIILANPTVNNIETIRYLHENKILKVNLRKVNFVGVWFEDQNYDFNRSKNFIAARKLKNYFLHEIRGTLHTDNLFQENDITDDLKIIFDHSAGIIFFGGPDIPPAVYGEENTRSVVTDPQRHYFEATFLFHLLGGSQNDEFEAWLNKRPQYLVTGFCLGMQTMNVATGGTLIQDIPAELYGTDNPEAIVNINKDNLHRNYWQQLANDTLLMGINLHPINFTEHSFFYDIPGVSEQLKPSVYSSHHQAAEKIGKGLVVTAVSADGKIVEAMAHQRFPNVFAVQFHPEVPSLYEDMELRKFHPKDEPASLNDLIGKQSEQFHREYWKHISRIIRKSTVKSE